MKRPSLFVTKRAEPEPQPEKPSEPVRDTRKYPVSNTRQGKRVATVYLEPEALRQLQKLAFDEEVTIQALLIEGINAVFESRGLTRLA